MPDVNVDALEVHQTFDLRGVEEAFKALEYLANQTAIEHGWWEERRSMAECIALMHSELSEALEQVRLGPLNGGSELTEIYPGEWANSNGQKSPEGVAVEFADVLIRIFDVCRHRNIPLAEALEAKMAYNTTREYRHGGKAL